MRVQGDVGTGHDTTQFRYGSCGGGIAGCRGDVAAGQVLIPTPKHNCVPGEYANQHGGGAGEGAVVSWWCSNKQFATSGLAAISR